MAISAITLTGTTWTAITAAGKSGICFTANTAMETQVMVTHSTSGVPAANTNAYIPLYPCNSNNDYMILSADNANDIFYARCTGTSDVVSIIVDVV